MKLGLWGLALSGVALMSGCAVMSLANNMRDAAQMGMTATETLRQGRCSEGLSLFEQANERMFEVAIAGQNLERQFNDREPLKPEEIKKMHAEFIADTNKAGVVGLGGQPIPGSVLYAARCYAELGQWAKAQKTYQNALQYQTAMSEGHLLFWAVDSLGGSFQQSMRNIISPEIRKKDWLNISALPEKLDDETLVMALSQIKSPELFRQINLDIAIRYANFSPEQEKIAWSVFNQKAQGQDAEAVMRMFRIKVAQLKELAKVSPRFANAMKAPTAKLSEMEPGQLFIDYTLQGEELVASVLQDQHFIVLERLDVPGLKARILSYRLLLAHPTLENLNQARQDIFDSGTQMTAWQENGDWWVGKQGTKSVTAQILNNESYIAGRAAAIQQHEKWLHDHLLGSFENRIKPPQSILIAPDNILATIPWFHLLQSSKYLRGVPLSLVHSLGIYQQIKHRQVELNKLYPRPNSGRKLIVADPAYDLAGGAANRNAFVKEVAQTEFVPPNKTYADAYARMQQLKWHTLPGAQAEGNEVRKILGGELLSASDATEENITTFLKASGQNLRYLHFATHGYFEPAFPSYSAIVLGKTGNTTANDGYLTAWEIPGLTLRTELAVLSACETGITVSESSDGVLGIPYALFLAGANQTLVTLWPIDDAATRVFMSKFWQQKLTGASAAKALLDTQTAFMRGEAGQKYKDPVYWGAFMLYGGVRN